MIKTNIPINDFIENLNINKNALYILPPTNNNLMMGYLIVFNKQIIMVDSGNFVDYNYQKEIIYKLGGVIDYLVITHCHCDHYGSASKMMEDSKITIKNLVYNFPPFEEIERVTAPHEIEFLHEFIKTLSNYKGKVIIPYKGYIISLDGISFNFLNNPYPSISDVNDQSICFRVDIDNTPMIMFLGDLSTISSDCLLKEYKDYENVLKCKYCQLAHHGQNGGSMELYQTIKPKYALWSGPKWIYDNDNGNGKDTGPLTSRQTEKWLKELNVASIFAWFDITSIDL